MKQKTRFDVLKRDRFTCRYCGRTPPDVELEVDHFVPRAGGGDDDPSNLVTACFECNRGKRHETILPDNLSERQRILGLIDYLTTKQLDYAARFPGDDRRSVDSYSIVNELGWLATHIESGATADTLQASYDVWLEATEAMKCEKP